MKTFTIISALIVFLLSSMNLSAQCCSKGSHKHDAKGAQHSQENTGDESQVKAKLNKDGVQEATITVKDGYTPSTIIAKKGVPLKLNFDLQEKSCTGTVIFKDLAIKKDLEFKKSTAVEFTPNATGSFAFACPMEMIKGTLIVED